MTKIGTVVALICRLPINCWSRAENQLESATPTIVSVGPRPFASRHAPTGRWYAMPFVDGTLRICVGNTLSLESVTW